MSGARKLVAERIEAFGFYIRLLRTALCWRRDDWESLQSEGTPIRDGGKTPSRIREDPLHCPPPLQIRTQEGAELAGTHFAGINDAGTGADAIANATGLQKPQYIRAQLARCPVSKRHTAEEFGVSSADCDHSLQRVANYRPLESRLA